MSPTFVISVLFLISDLFAIAGNMIWNVEINFLLLVVFICGTVSLFFGELFARGIKIKVHAGDLINTSKGVISVPKFRMLILIVAEIIVLVLYYRRLEQIAYSIGYSGTMLIQYNRVATIDEGIKVGSMFTIFLGVISGGAFSCIYILINNIYIVKNRKKLKGNLIYFVPIILYILSSILSGARNGFIRLGIMIFSCFLIQYQERFKKVKIMKITVIGSIALGVFLVLFVNLGKLTGKTTASNSVDIILLYVGSAIVGLSCWLGQGKVFTSTHFGAESFWGLRYLANKFFGSITVVGQYAEGVKFPNGTETNIYTGFRAYLYDFGWVGMSLMMFIIGFVITWCYLVIKQKRKPRLIVIYSFFFCDFIYLLFAPSITSNLFTSSQIFGVAWIYIIMQYLLKEKKHIKNTSL